MEPAIPASAPGSAEPRPDSTVAAVGASETAFGEATEPRDGREVLEAQVRECFGRVVYSHKTHEKCTDRAIGRLSAIKIAQIVLSAVTTGGLLAVVFGPADKSRMAAGLAAVVSTALLALNAYTKENDLGKVAQQHKEAADRLWVVRESYLSLLTDLRAGLLSPDLVRARRDELQAALATVYQSAPRTSPAGYASASKALKVSEDLTFSDDEIDQFLPGPLKKRA
jgi:hypothetical protein